MSKLITNIEAARSSTMKAANLIGLFALLLIIVGLTAGPIYGQATIIKFRDTFSFSDGTLNPCNGEFVSFDGTIRSITHFTITPNDETITNFNAQSTGNGQGDLGNTYNIHANHHFKFVTQPGAAEVQLADDTMRVISQSSADNFLLETVFRITFNANGEPTHVDVDFASGKCVG